MSAVFIVPTVTVSPAEFSEKPEKFKKTVNVTRPKLTIRYRLDTTNDQQYKWFISLLNTNKLV